MELEKKNIALPKTCSFVFNPVKSVLFLSTNAVMIRFYI